MRGLVLVVGIVAFLYIAMVGAGAAAAPRLAQLVHGPPTQVTEYVTNTYHEEKKILSDNTVKIASDNHLFSDANLFSENKWKSDNPVVTTNETEDRSSHVTTNRSTEGGDATLAWFAAAVLGVVALGTSMVSGGNSNE